MEAAFYEGKVIFGKFEVDKYFSGNIPVKPAPLMRFILDDHDFYYYTADYILYKDIFDLPVTKDRPKYHELEFLVKFPDNTYKGYIGFELDDYAMSRKETIELFLRLVHILNYQHLPFEEFLTWFNFDELNVNKYTELDEIVDHLMNACTTEQYYYDPDTDEEVIIEEPVVYFSNIGEYTYIYQCCRGKVIISDFGYIKFYTTDRDVFMKAIELKTQYLHSTFINRFKEYKEGKITEGMLRGYLFRASCNPKFNIDSLPEEVRDYIISKRE